MIRASQTAAYDTIEYDDEYRATKYEYENFCQRFNLSVFNVYPRTRAKWLAMPRIRLIGLILFTTSLFLALVAGATGTSHIRVRDWQQVASPTPGEGESAPGIGFLDDEPLADMPPWRDTRGTLEDGSQTALPASGAQVVPVFVAIPIYLPLGLAGLAGLVLWFLPAARPQSSKRRRRRRRK